MLLTMNGLRMKFHVAPVNFMVCSRKRFEYIDKRTMLLMSDHDIIVSSTSNSNSSYSSSTSVGEINVYTQAPDADGIAGDIGGAVSNRFNYGFANGGVY